MPYKLRKAPRRNLYWVVSKDTGLKHSKDPLPMERAKAQMRALYANEGKEGGGFLGDVWNAVGDKVDKVKSEWKDKGMATLTGTNYTGAWNRLDDEYLRTHPPTDIIDKGALEHDLEYSRLAKLRKEGKTPKADLDRMIRESDDKFLQNIRDNWRANPWAGVLGYAGIKGKNIAEDTVGLDKHLFVGEGKKGGFIMKGLPQPAPIKYSRPQDQPYYKEAEARRMEMIEKLRGSGFFGDMWNSAKSVVNTVVSRVKDVSMGFRNDFSPSVRGLLGFIGDKPVVQMFVRRDPIQSALNTALNFISLGKWNEVRNKYGFDKFFHLRLEVILRVSDSPVILAKYTLEKNEVINIQKAFPIESQTEIMPVEMKGEITVNQLLEGAKKIQGDTFHRYDAFHNNCQDFVGAMLQSNGLLTPEVAEFIKQDIRQAISELPSWTGKIARGLTDAGALANVALEGRGGLHPMAKFAKQMASMGVNPAQYLALAKKKAKALGLADNMLGFSTDAKHKLQIPNADGRMIRFGAVGLGDYILYSLSGDKTADQHRSNYRKRATKIKGDWEKDPYSANNLAIGVLW